MGESNENNNVGGQSEMMTVTKGREKRKIKEKKYGKKLK